MSQFREIAVYRSKVRIATIRRYRADAALNGPATDRRASSGPVGGTFILGSQEQDIYTTPSAR